MNAATLQSHAVTEHRTPVLGYAPYAAGYLLLALFSTKLPLFDRVPLFIWPAHGLALGVLLTAPRRSWPLYVLIAAVAAVSAGALTNTSPRTIAMLGLFSAILPPIAALALQRLAGPRMQLGTIRGLAALLVGMVPIAVVMGILEAAFAFLGGAEFRQRWTSAFVSTILGMLLIAPLVLVWSEGWRTHPRPPQPSRTPELIALYVGLIVTTHYIFAAPAGDSIRPSLLYLCAPFLIWAALRFGLRSATLGLAMFGLVCYWHTGNGRGPFAVQMANEAQLLHLHAYLATTIVITLFSAALLGERRNAAREAEEWRDRHERVMRASESLLYELKPTGPAIMWDGDTRRVIGADAAAVARIPEWLERVHPDDRMRIKGLRRQLVAGQVSHIDVEYRFRRDDGTYSTLGVNAYLIADPAKGRDARRVIGFVKDVSERVKAEEERRRLEAQLKQADKMQAVGHLAGGIAHDFNNILGAILGYGELAQRKAPPDLKRYLDTIMDAGNRGKSLVNQILSFSRAEGSDKVPVIVPPIAQEVCDLVRGSISSAIEVRFENATTDDAMVMGDPTRLHQLLMNLCTNAVHAMEGGGTLVLGAAVESVKAPRKVRSGEVPMGDYVRLSVTDTGHGIAPEVIDRIFEPFFTTKPAGRGTGLGLALVHSVVTEHQGYIEVSSELGRGSTFTVWMPRIEGANAAAKPAETEMPMGRGQAILVVDDEPEVLAALEEMLATLGYEPAGFRNGREALEAMRKEPRRFEAAVSDEVMPELTGTQLAIELRKINPELKILIASGYGGAGFETRALTAGVNRVLKKPYRMSEIAEVLDGFFK
jgi:PAS domain S-box-containing protein